MYWCLGHHTLQQRLQQPRLSSERIVVFGGLSDRPNPGRSGMTMRALSPTTAATSRHATDDSGMPWTAMTVGGQDWGGVQTEHADPVDDVAEATEVVRGRPWCSHDWQLLFTFW